MRGIPHKKNRGEDKTRWFFLDDEPYSILKIDRHNDYVYCQTWPDLKRVGFPWSYIKKKSKKAYVTTEVEQILNRSKSRIEHLIMEGKITPKVHINPLGFSYSGFHLYTEEEILDAHTYFIQNPRGRPTKDGRPKNIDVTLPTRAEVKARLKGSVVQYIKNKNGEFIPVWKENEW